MAFREKVLWSSLASTVLVWGWYFIGYLQASEGDTLDATHALMRFITAVVLVVVVQVIITVAIAITSHRDAAKAPDDRERSFALAAYRPAFQTLSAAIFVVMSSSPWLVRNAPAASVGGASLGAAIAVGNALMLSIVLAEIARSGAQILAYRRGA